MDLAWLTTRVQSLIPCVLMASAAVVRATLHATMSAVSCHLPSTYILVNLAETSVASNCNLVTVLVSMLAMDATCDSYDVCGDVNAFCLNGHCSCRTGYLSNDANVACGEFYREPQRHMYIVLTNYGITGHFCFSVLVAVGSSSSSSSSTTYWGMDPILCKLAVGL